MDDNPHSGMDAAASIGFGSAGIRGSVVLLTDAKNADDLGATEQHDLGDWLGELANQLVGRFKNKIAQYGILLNMGLPVTLSAETLQLTSHGEASWLVDCKAFRLAATLSLHVNDDLRLVANAQSAVAEEGSLCLF